MTTKNLAKSVLTLGAILAIQGTTVAQTALPKDAASLRLPSPVTAGQLPSRLRQQVGDVQVAVRLSDQPLALAVGLNAKRVGSKLTLDQRRAYVASLKAKQDALMAQVRGLGGSEVARLTKTYNGLVVSIDAAKLPQVARLAGVTGIRPVVDFEKHLGSTVPYVGAAALQSLGVTGAGVKIAVLDSGIDYTHKNLGGSGLVSDFNAAAAAAPGPAPAGLFPTAKVIGGYDFVGEAWPNGAAVPDANPIDAGVSAGHGTHVADIAAGASLDGTHKGVAPGAKLYAVKVCSSTSTSCNGLAILQGLEWAMDPKGDLSFDGAADIVNLSLGASYGQRENPSTEAVTNLVRFGIVAAISAGNSADRPYILGSPSNSPEAISVAQTALPSGMGFSLVVTAPSPATYTNTNTLPWAPITTGFSGTLKIAGPAGSAAAQACTPGVTVDYTGTVALLDRGTCNISTKVKNATDKGAIGVILANNAAGDAPSFSLGSETPPFAQTLVVTQAIGAALRGMAGPVQVAVDPSVFTSLAGSMTSTSSRGPSYDFGALKPEIGAPGASTSALYGTGTGTEPFGGTSGAAPMVTGAAALLLEKYPSALPTEVKARLMNAAHKDVVTNPQTAPGVLAPVSRIGGGELRADKSVALTTTLWDSVNPYGVGLSFGSMRVAGLTTVAKKVAVRNHSASPRTYTIARSFRYTNDEASGAVTLTAPASISVPGNSTGAFTVQMKIDPSKLPAWNLYSGSTQGNGALLQAVEFDGYLSVSEGGETAAIPWHVLPHRAHNAIAAGSGSVAAGIALSNLGGAQTATMEVFALTGTSPQSSNKLSTYGGGQPLVDLKAIGVRPVDVGLPAVQFGIATFGEKAHPAYPAEYDIYVDSNNDGVDDYVIYNSELSGFGVSGQTVVSVFNLNTGTTVTNFYAAADLNSSNMIFTVLASDIGITSPAQKFRFAVYSFDNYFTGDMTDAITGMTHTLGTPKFASPLGDTLGIPLGFSGALPVSAPAGGAAASPSQTGLLMLYRDAKSKRESDIVTITP
jgi:subtilisin family serine protease